MNDDNGTPGKRADFSVTDAAQKFAKRKYADYNWSVTSSALAARVGFIDGAEWQAAQPRTVTRAEWEKAARAAFDSDVAMVGGDPFGWDSLRELYLRNQHAAFAAVGITVEDGT